MAAALPYIHIPVIPLGPIDIQPFGILVATGVILGAHVIRRYADKHELDYDLIQGMIGWCAIGGFIGAHWLDVLFYQPGAITSDPIILVKFWAGISSFGGFIGGTVGYLIFIYLNRDERFSRLGYADAVMLGLVLGFSFGRLGCTIVFDHPGTASDFVLAMHDRAGIMRHNLGLYELLWMIVITAVLFLVARREQRPRGFLVGLGCTMYGPVRFMFDFLRIPEAAGGDQRYFGLTFAHYTSLAVTAFGVALMVYAYRHRHDPDPEKLAAEADDDEPVPRATARQGAARHNTRKKKKKRK